MASTSNRIAIAGVAFLLLSALCLTALIYNGSKAKTGQRHPQYYQDSMHPWIKSDLPGKCTICEMDLTPVYDGEKGFALKPGTVVLHSNAVTVLNVQSQEVGLRTIARTLRVSGMVQPCETKKTIIAAPAAGRIQSTEVGFVGKWVVKGQPLFTLFSSELVQRRAYLKSIGGDQSSLGRGLMQASSSDPYLGEMPAPFAGVITEKNAYAGQYVMEGEKLFTLVDPSVVWFQFEVYDKQVNWLQAGDRIEIRSPALSGRKIVSNVSFVSPVADSTSHTVKARVELANPMMTNSGPITPLLPIGLSAEATIRTVISNALALPRSAVAFNGESAYVYLDNEDGSYHRQPVSIGRRGDDYYEVLAGVENGDRVVTAGNVLLDAEAQLVQSGQGDMISELQLPTTGANQENADAEVMVMPAIQSPADQNKMPTMNQEKTSKETVHETHHSVPSSTQAPDLAVVVHESHPAAMKAMATPVDADDKPAKTTSTNKWAQAAIGRSSVMGAMMSPGAELQTMRRQAIIEGRAKDAAGEAGQTNDPAMALALSQQRTLRGLVEAANTIGMALADGKLKVYYQCASSLPTLFTRMRADFAAEHPLQKPLQNVALNGLAVARTGDWQSAKNLAGARTLFAPYSSSMAELAHELKKDQAAFGDVHIFRETKGTNMFVWLQLSPVAHNPFGSEGVSTNHVEEVP